MKVIVNYLFIRFVLSNPCVPDPCQNSGVCTYQVGYYNNDIKIVIISILLGRDVDRL